MGEVIELLPLEIRDEMAALERLRDDLLERRLVVMTRDGADATVREAANLDTVIRDLEKAVRRLGKRTT